MTSERWQRVKELFEAALERGPAERAAFLARACEGDEEVRREVESLVAAHEGDSGFMNTPAGKLLPGDEPLLAAGQRFGEYEVLSPLGEGGMGQVYLALDTRLGRKVALKLLPSSHTGDADRVSRFELEARAASALNHPNIVTVHEIGRVDSFHYIAAEFVEGVTLRERVAGTRMTVGEVLDVAAQVASALQAAHEAGIVHRDVKPENVMLRPDGFAKVLDFGLAKLTPRRSAVGAPEAPARAAVRTNPGVVMGTVGYMSPEQARGEEVDARTDVWSLGVVLYEMVAGRAPFAGETPSHVIVSILESEPLPLPRGAEVPAELEGIITKALRKKREERYRTAGEMALDLRSLKEELTVEARLQRFRGPDAGSSETAARSGGRVALNTPHAATASSAGVAVARLRSSAEYLADGVRRHKGGAVFASVTALLLVASLAYFSGFNEGGGEAIDSVAVLSFVNESGDPEAEYLSDGISDGVIGSLSRLPDLRVVSFSTVLRYKGRQVDPQAVGRELKVRAVLVGRMARRGDALTVSAELVDVRDNRRLWGGQYNRRPSETLAVQEEIAEEIAEKLRLRPGGAEQRRLTRHHTESADAYDAYLRGRFLLEKRTPRATEKSVEYLEQAVRLDPDYAPAYATLSYAYWSSRSVSGDHIREVLPQAKEAAAKALALDATLAEAHSALGHIGQSERDWAGAGRSFRRAVELNPNSGFAHSNYAFHFIAMRRFDEAVAVSRRAVEIEPTSVLYNRNVAMMLYFARRYDEAIEQARKTLELDPDMETAYRWLAKSYEQKGLYGQAAEAWLQAGEFSAHGPEAEAALREAYAASGWQGFCRKSLELKMERVKQGKVSPYAMAETYARLGEKDQAFAWLERAYERGGWFVTTINADSIWDFLRSDPRYQDLVRRMGLEP